MEHLKLILILKNGINCGIYLKWFNANGGYSYWLFDKFIQTTSTKPLMKLLVNMTTKTLILFSNNWKKLMQPIKYKHVLLCFIKNISQVY
jgi:hypothetical protein